MKKTTFITILLTTVFMILGAAQIFAAGEYQGTWNTKYGELRLYEVGGKYVIGEHSDGLLIGEIVGNEVRGVTTFTAGSVNELWLKADGTNKLIGNLQSAGDGGDFSGTRVIRKTNNAVSATDSNPNNPALVNFTRDGSAITPSPGINGIGGGIWKSQHGVLNLLALNSFLFGDYGTKGVILAVWDGSKYVGHFTNGKKVGWVEFPFNPNINTASAARPVVGSYGFLGSGGSGTWQITELMSQRSGDFQQLKPKVAVVQPTPKPTPKATPTKTNNNTNAGKPRKGIITLDDIKIENPEEFRDEPYIIVFTVRAKIGSAIPEVYLNPSSGPKTIMSGNNWATKGVTQSIPTKVGQMSFAKVQDYEVYGIYVLMLEEDNTSAQSRGAYIRDVKNAIADTFKKEFTRSGTLSGSHKQKMDATLLALAKVNYRLYKEAFKRLFEVHTKAGVDDDDLLGFSGIFSMTLPSNENLPSDVNDYFYNILNFKNYPPIIIHNQNSDLTQSTNAWVAKYQSVEEQLLAMLTLQFGETKYNLSFHHEEVDQ